MNDEPALVDLLRPHPKNSLRAFCETYLDKWFTSPWWSSQISMIRSLEDTIRHDSSNEKEMERGKGSTTLLMAAAIWALACRHRGRVLLITDTLDASQNLGWCIEEATRHNQALKEAFRFRLHARNSSRLEFGTGEEMGSLIFGSLNAMPRTPCDLQLVDNAVNYDRAPSIVAKNEEYLSRIFHSVPTFIVRSVETPKS